jgi:hypothetical protein
VKKKMKMTSSPREVGIETAVEMEMDFYVMEIENCAKVVVTVAAVEGRVVVETVTEVAVMMAEAANLVEEKVVVVVNVLVVAVKVKAKVIPVKL